MKTLRPWSRFAARLAIVASQSALLSVAALSLAALVSLAAHSAWAQNEVLVIEGGTLIDGTGRNPAPNSVVVIEGSRIRSVGTRGSVTVPPGARVIRADGKTVLPGLIDAHVHFLDFMPQLFLRYGVTTVYDTANPTEWIIAQRDAVRSGRIQGPRMFVTGAIIDGPPEIADPVTFAARAAYRIHTRTPEEARAATRGLIGQGVDAIKVYEGLEIESLRAVVDEAHKAGIEVVGHMHDAREAIEAGVKFIEHPAPIAHSTIGDEAKLQALAERRLPNPESQMNPALFDPLIKLMVDNKVFFNPTLTRGTPESREWFDEVKKLLEDPSAHFITEARRESWLEAIKDADNAEYPARMRRRAEAIAKVREFIRRFAQAGGKMITGPDSGPRSSPTNIAGLAMAVEMEGLVNAGLTPMQAILASTKWSAEMLHKEKDLGTVEPGKLADVIVVDGDPLTDRRAISRVQTVILDGKVIDTRFDPNFRNPLPRTFYVDTPFEQLTPAISALSPGTARAGNAGITIELKGERFTPRTVVRFDAAEAPAQFVNDSTIRVTVAGTLLRNPGTYAITAINPGSGGGPSNTQYFLVNFPE